MEWIGYTNHHLWGNISIVLIIITWLFVNRKSMIDPKANQLIILVIMIALCVLSVFYTLFLAGNPQYIYIIF